MTQFEFFTDEQRREYERAFPYHATGSAGPSGLSAENYEEFRRKRKLRAKWKKQEKRKKGASKKESTEKEKQKFQGTEEEIASMIQKLNAMNINDLDYAPIYYKVMVMDKTGTAGKCVKPPFGDKTEKARTKGPPNNAASAPADRPSTPATYPNNIPLGKPPQNTGGREFSGCFGCLGDGHRISDCQQIADLVSQNIIAYNDETRRLTMKNGSPIWHQAGESLAKAAECIAGGSAPRVMLGVLDTAMNTRQSVQNFYQEENRRARIVEIYSDTSEDSDNSDTDLGDESDTPREVFLTAPERVGHNEEQVYPVERSVPSTRAARKEVLDGVYPPIREKGKPRIGRTTGDKDQPPAADLRPKAVQLPSDQNDDSKKKEPVIVERPIVGPRIPSSNTKVPVLIPVEARKVRFDTPEDVDMPEEVKEKPGKKGIGKKSESKENTTTKEKENIPLKSTGRQSELTVTVNQQELQSFALFTAAEPRESLARMKEHRMESENLQNRQMASQTNEIGSAQTEKKLTEPVLTVNPTTTSSFEEAVSQLSRVEQKGNSGSGKFWSTNKSMRTCASHDRELFNSAEAGIGHLLQFLSTIASPVMTDLGRSDSSSNNNAPFEPVQYLSHHAYRHPPTPAIVLNGETPAQIIDGAVTRQWGRYFSKAPTSIRPTFSAAPQSEYYGAVTLPDGQIVHCSSGQNTFRFFFDEDTGDYWTIPCHEVIWSFQAPVDPTLTWQYKLFYPSNERLHRAMENMMPASGTTTPLDFPVHATNQTPSLPRRIASLGAVLAVRPIFPIPVSGTKRERQESSGNRTVDALITDLLGPHTLPTPPLTDSSSTSDHAFPSELEHDINQRAEFGLQLWDENGKVLGAPSNNSLFVRRHGSAPASSESTDDKTPAKALQPPFETCSFCLAAHHGPGVGCPLWGAAPPSGFRTMATDVVDASAAPPGMTYYLDDIVFAGQLMNNSAGGDREVEAMKQALDRLLTPTLDELLALPITETSMFQDIAAAAIDICQAFERFKPVIEQRQREKKIFEEMKRSVEDPQMVLPDDSDDESSHDSMPDLIDFRTIDARGRGFVNDSGRDLRDAPPPVSLDHFPTAPHSHADRVESPTFDYQRGPVVPRDLWSSSSPASSDSSWGEELPVPAETLGASFANLSNSAISEWSVSSSEFRIDPCTIIDTAIARVISQAPSRVLSPDSATVASNESIAPVVPLATVDPRLITASGGPSFPDTRPFSPTAHSRHEGLGQWAQTGAINQSEEMQWEDEACGAPLLSVLRMLHGPLRGFLDYVSMAADSARRLELLSALSLDLESLPVHGPSSPDPTQSPTSLDFSLPDHETSSSAPRSPISSPPKRGTANKANGKRKATDDGRTVTPHKRFRKFYGDSLRRKVIEHEAYKVLDAANAPTIAMFTGARLGIMASAQSIEQIVWQRYNITEVSHEYRIIEQRYAELACPNSQTNFPSRFVWHPLLSDLETAKLHTLWSVLHQNQCYMLAMLVMDVLTIRLRHNGDVAPFITPALLTRQHSGAQYSDLLPFRDEPIYPDHRMESMEETDPSLFQPPLAASPYPTFLPNYTLGIAAEPRNDTMDDDSDGWFEGMELQYPDSEAPQSPSEREVDAYLEDPFSGTFADSDDEISMHGTGGREIFYVCRAGEWVEEQRGENWGHFSANLEVAEARAA
ncbi:hypothetical protein FB451DRAFT_1188588 [Mycena latifolia]|nr:hypothetical protein FB451DRAFT_1188588 [Mycena latifolia]